MANAPTYFELFQLPRSFEVDLNELQARYRTLQAAMHPDKHAHKSDQEKRIAVQRTADLNDAYRVLKDPRRRGLYLLALRGIHHSEESTLGNDAAFLMQQMEWREALSDAREKAEPVDYVETLLGDFRRQYETFVQQLAGHLAAGTADDDQAAGELCKKIQFVEKLLSEADDLLADLEEEFD